MSKSWYLMDQYPIYNGGFEGEEFHNYARQGFQEMLDTTMLCDNVEFITSDFSTITSGKAIIQSVTSDTQIKADERQILAPIGTLYQYAYIRFDGDVWIIASEPSNNKFYEKAVLKICHNKLRWQNTANKKIFDYYYWCEDITRYSSGTYLGNVVIKYDKQYHLLLPFNDDTRTLQDGMRFILEKSNNTPLVYKLTKFDGITGNNKNVKLLNLTLTQTVYDEDRDNVDMMIADYYTENSISKDLDCKINYDSDEIAISSFGIFVADFGDESDTIGTNDFMWEISGNDFNLENLVCTSQDYQLKIIVKNNKELIGQTFTLKVIVAEKECASLEVKIIALW